MRVTNCVRTYVCVYVCMYVCMYVQGNAVEIRKPTQCNLIGHSMIALSPVLSSSSSFPPPPFHFSLFTVKENLVHVYKISFQIFKIFKLSKSEIA